MAHGEGVDGRFLLLPMPSNRKLLNVRKGVLPRLPDVDGLMGAGTRESGPATYRGVPGGRDEAEVGRQQRGRGRQRPWAHERDLGGSLGVCHVGRGSVARRYVCRSQLSIVMLGEGAENSLCETRVGRAEGR